MNTRSLSDFLDQNFFERGAFLKNYETEKVILGKGGSTKERTSQDEIKDSFYLKDFYRDRFLVYTPDELIETTLSELRETVSDWAPETFEIEDEKDEDHLYTQDFQNLLSSFSDQLKKAVLVSRDEFTIRDAQAARKSFFVKSLAFGTGYPSGIWFDEIGMIGSTPEILFSISGSLLKTFALAGTAKADEGEKLLASQKDRLEHEIVIRDIQEKLLPFSADIKIGETHLHPYKNIVHLKTNIEAEFSGDTNPLKIVAALSPTAALGGYPAREALKFLREGLYAQRHPKRYFGSAFGYTSPSLNQAVVMIRNIQWIKDRFIIESGGGVVPGSILEKELAEIQLKRQSIKGHYL